MVNVKSYDRKVNSKTGEEFFTLVVESSAVDLVRSKSGKMYATKRSCSLGTTLDEPSCQALIGSTLEGKICRIDCEPYEVVDKNTREIRVSDHRYEFFMEGEDPSTVKAETSLIANEELVSA